jgi:hypothetical protein
MRATMAEADRTRIRKFVEALDFGRITNRVACAADVSALPAATKGAQWREDPSFDEQLEVSQHPDFRRVLEHSRKNGFATVDRKI